MDKRDIFISLLLCAMAYLSAMLYSQGRDIGNLEAEIEYVKANIEMME